MSTDDAPLVAYLGDDRTDPHAVRLHLEPQARARVLAMPRQPDVSFIPVKDYLTRTWWAVRPAACPADCFCALEAHPLGRRHREKRARLDTTNPSQPTPDDATEALPLRALTPALDLLDHAHTHVIGLPLDGITIEHFSGNILLTTCGPLDPRIQAWSDGFGIDWEINDNWRNPPVAQPDHWHGVQVLNATAVAYGHLPVVLALINTREDCDRGDVHIEVRDKNDVLAWAQIFGGYHATDHEYRVDSAVNGTPLSVSALIESGPHPAQVR